MKKYYSQLSFSTIVLCCLGLAVVLAGIPSLIQWSLTAAIILTLLAWLIFMLIGIMISGSDFNVPEYTAKSRVPSGSQYRLKKDSPYIIRIKSLPPEPEEDGKFVRFIDDVMVAGISHYKDNAGLFIFGRVRQIRLEREPDNPHDRNAIRVLGSWKAPDGERVEVELGHLPKEVAQTIAEWPAQYPIRAILDRMFVPKGRQSPGLRLNLFWPEARWRKKLDNAAESI